MLQEQCGRRDPPVMVVRHRMEERRLASAALRVALRGGIDLGAASQQEAHHLHGAEFRGQMQQRPTVRGQRAAAG